MLSCSAQEQAIQTVSARQERNLKLRLYKVEYESFPGKHVQHCCMLSCSAQGQAIQSVPTMWERSLKLRLYKVEYASFPSKHVQQCCMLISTAAKILRLN